MNKRSANLLGVLSGLTAVILLAAGCSPASGEINVDKSDNGSQVELLPGQILLVTLESNPSTGYAWEISEIDSALVRQVGEVEFVSEPSGEPLVGQGGVEIFRFEAVDSGISSLTLVYHRVWEDVAPLETFTIEISVP